MDIWKEVLCVGEQMDPKTRRWFKITPRRIADAHRNAKRMLSRGVPLPAVWEHQDIEAGDAPPDADAVAEWKRNYARYTFAFIGDSRINDRGNLELRHDGVSAEDAARLERVRGVSPKIYNGYCDSRGGEYEGTTVAHVAATPTPVQYWQKSWELSDSDPLYLSYPVADAALLDAPEAAECPSYTSDVDDWFESLDLSATDAPDASDEEPTVADDADKGPPKKGDDDKGGGMNAELKAVVKAIKDAFGASISDKVSSWHELVIALESNSGGGNPEPEPEPEPAPDEETTGAAGGPPMVMSTLDKNDARRKQAERYAKDERADAAARIDAALKSGRLTPPDARKLKRQADGFELSFTDGEQTGAKWKKLLADIEAAEKRPANSAWKPTGAQTGIDLSSTEAAPAPDLAAPDRARGEEIGNWIVKGGKLPAKK